MNPDILRKALEALEELGRGLDAQNEVPSTAPAPAPVPVTAGAPAVPVRKLLSPADRFALGRELRAKSTDELLAMFSLQARKKDAGIPFDLWAASGGQAIHGALEQDAFLTKALDTGGATAMIRQDLEPIMLELYIRQFPYWDRISKEPSNGLVHAYVRTSSFGDAQFMSELGTVTDDVSVYDRQTSPIAVLATRRGISLKSQFATIQGGAGFNPEQLELTGGLRAIAHKMQKTLFQGNATASGGTAADEDGAYDANSFTGLRSILNTVRAENVDPTLATPEDIRAALDKGATTAMQNAGTIGIAYLDPSVKTTFDLQQDKNVRYMNAFVDAAPGVLTNAVNTVFGPLPLAVVPGDSIGSYTRSATKVSDIYLLDESVITVPYLGSAGPTVLDIPIGISGQLDHLFIIFGMWGLAVKAPQFCNKVRVKLA